MTIMISNSIVCVCVFFLVKFFFWLVGNSSSSLYKYTVFLKMFLII